ncbi:MAG TPA: ThiF family adenylyltransferase [Candidatus Moranbacteria bacterium]|nr:ThiF family adenylyltransferase [Candidatus Moranbacteria bacterium]HRZ34130.1 ThiF family adenylyltransferase [Candidatus Moranbacteria bacterium]
MLRKQISLSPDLKKLQDEGYEIEVKSGYLLVHHVPYVNSQKEIAYGTLVSKLELASDKTVNPVGDHVMRFIGEHPCNHDGTVITAIQHASNNEPIVDGLTTNHSFSSKPPSGQYPDYYQKIITYERILSSQAKHIDTSVTAITFKTIEPDDEESVHHYIDTNSTRADIGLISAKLKDVRVAIVGLGGTGSYVLDFISKTEVREIHLFDADDFLQHNAFRSPGAASKEKLDERLKKVDYFHGVYSKMHKKIFSREYHLTDSNLEEISGMDFVFICIDEGKIKKQIAERLIEKKIPFVDTGIGIQSIDGALIGCIRTTMATPEKNDHLGRRIDFSDGGHDAYTQNIQIAELNALNASLAVIKMKKHFGFYYDQEKEYNSSYEISINKIINDETNS